MTVSPRFVWPPGGILNVPSVESDDDVPTPEEEIRAVSAYWIEGVLRVKLSDGTTVNVGPAAPPPAPGISPRAVVSVKSALPDTTPQITYSLGDGIIVGAFQSELTFSYQLSCSVPISDETCAVQLTVQGQTPLQSMAVDFPGGGTIRVSGFQADIEEGGVTINATSLDFWLVLW